MLRNRSTALCPKYYRFINDHYWAASLELHTQLIPRFACPQRQRDPIYQTRVCTWYRCKLLYHINLPRCGSRIWSRGGPQLLRPKVADIAKRSRASEVSILWPGSRARLRALEAFGFLMLKYAFSHILETLFLLFLTSILTPKVDKNRALDFTSINLRHSDMLHLFFNLHEKVML